VFPRVNIQDHWLLIAPPGSDASDHPKATGWMTEHTFFKCMKDSVKYAASSEAKPIFLMLDNRASHYSHIPRVHNICQRKQHHSAQLSPSLLPQVIAS